MMSLFLLAASMTDRKEVENMNTKETNQVRRKDEKEIKMAVTVKMKKHISTLLAVPEEDDFMNILHSHRNSGSCWDLH